MTAEDIYRRIASNGVDRRVIPVTFRASETTLDRIDRILDKYPASNLSALVSDLVQMGLSVFEAMEGGDHDTP